MRASMILAAAAIAATLGGCTPQDGDKPIRISQKGRVFAPGEIEVSRGAVLEFVNDDDAMRHHVYVDDPAFTFDSGDQEPGTTTRMKLDRNGRFMVLCGIHPKMKLKVTVR